MTPHTIRPVVQFRSPEPLIAALHVAAARDMTNVSTFIRLVLLEKLRALGIEPSCDLEQNAR